jgi:hypothetical protein
MTTTYTPSAAEEREGIHFPKRLIIANFTHGSITIQEDGTEKTFVVPPNMKIKRAWASVPGVCNFITSETNALFTNYIENSKKRLETIPFESVDAEFNVFLSKFKEADKKDTLKELTDMVKSKKDILKSGDESQIDTLMEAERYINNFDKFFQLTTYLPGDVVVDKLFSRTNAEAINKTKGREWVMLMINMSGIGNDLLTLMIKQTRFGRNKIYLSQIIEYLQSEGVEEIIFFDNSCSTFMDEEENEFGDREIRARRRSILNKSSSTKFGGKKGKKSYKKRKINKKNKSKRRR